MSDTPNYAALVKLLPTLRNLVDACGEVTLTAEEAAQIRLLGFPAEAGRWKVPPIPFELVRDNPLLENLSIGWDPGKNYASPIPVRETESRSKDAKATGQYPPAREVEIHDRYDVPYKPPPAPILPGGDYWEVFALASKILLVVEQNNAEINERRLQQKFWRYRAPIFNQALRLLARRGQITLGSNS